MSDALIDSWSLERLKKAKETLGHCQELDRKMNWLCASWITCLIAPICFMVFFPTVKTMFVLPFLAGSFVLPLFKDRYTHSKSTKLLKGEIERNEAIVVEREYKEAKRWLEDNA